jgi:hypothetical protein
MQPFAASASSSASQIESWRSGLNAQSGPSWWYVTRLSFGEKGVRLA